MWVFVIIFIFFKINSSILESLADHKMVMKDYVIFLKDVLINPVLGGNFGSSES